MYENDGHEHVWTISQYQGYLVCNKCPKSLTSYEWSHNNLPDGNFDYYQFKIDEGVNT